MNGLSEVHRRGSARLPSLRPRLPRVMIVLGFATPLVVESMLLPWGAPWLVAVADAAMPMVPVGVGLALGHGGARWRQVGVGLGSMALLLAAMWLTRGGELGVGYALVMAVPVLPIVIGILTVVERSLPPRARGYGLGLAIGGTSLLLSVLIFPLSAGVVIVALLATAAVLERDRLPRVVIIRTRQERGNAQGR